MDSFVAPSFHETSGSPEGAANARKRAGFKKVCGTFSLSIPIGRWASASSAAAGAL